VQLAIVSEFAKGVGISGKFAAAAGPANHVDSASDEAVQLVTVSH
jgi:hypothetical protein